MSQATGQSIWHDLVMFISQKDHFKKPMGSSCPNARWVYPSFEKEDKYPLTCHPVTLPFHLYPKSNIQI